MEMRELTLEMEGEPNRGRLVEKRPFCSVDGKSPKDAL